MQGLKSKHFIPKSLKFIWMQMGFCEMKTGGAKVWGLAGGVQNVTFEKWDAKLYMKGVDEEKKETFYISAVVTKSA